MGTWTELTDSTAVGFDRPYLVEHDGQRLVVFRQGDGTPAIVSDYCVHRGGVISDGWLSEDRTSVVCPYHGWAFDGEGRCTHIPTNQGVPIPDDIRITTYPCIERDGTIWVHLAAEAPQHQPAEKDRT